MNTDQTERTGTVFDIGYQSYEGVREGRGQAWQTIIIDGLKNGMGIGRGGWAKFLPWLVLSPTIITGLVFAALAAFVEQLGIEVGDGNGAGGIELPGHLDLITPTAFMLLIFAAFVGPELVCPDRRNRVIHLYFVRPITLIDYLGARWCALVLLLLTASLLPHITLWIGLLIGVPDAIEHVKNNWTDIPRLISNSVVFALFAASFTFALSSLTDRRMIATLIVFGTLVILALSDLIVEIFDTPDFITNLIALLDLIELNTEVVPSIFFGTYEESFELNVFLPIAWTALLIVGSIFATWRFYQAQR